MAQHSPLFVGPATDPDAFELIARLDEGGASEAWRARQRGSDEPLVVKIFASDSESWVSAAEHLPSLRHPGLARVRNAFVGDAPHRRDQNQHHSSRSFVVTHEAAGLPLAAWLRAHPDASLTDRAGLLRQVAAALDAMRTAGNAVPHGAVKPSNIIVGPDGSTMLVGPSGTGSVEEDSLAFALTAVHAFTGQPPPADNERAALARQLRGEPRTRRHPALVRALLAAATGPTETRPRQLRRWLDESLESQRETVTSHSDPELGAQAPSGAGWRRKRLLPALAALVVAGAVGAYIGLERPSGSHASPSTPTPEPLSVRTLSWPQANLCSTAGAVAMPDGGRPLATYKGRADPRSAAIPGGAGAWQRGTVTFTLVSNSSHVIFIQDVTAQMVAQDRRPVEWIYRTAHSGCPTVGSGANHDYDLRVGGQPTERSAELPAGQRVRPFALPAGDTVTLAVHAEQCAVNTTWTLSVAYLQAGGRQDTLAIGTYRTFAIATNSLLGTGDLGSGGMELTRTSKVSEMGRRCAR